MSGAACAERSGSRRQPARLPDALEWLVWLSSQYGLGCKTLSQLAGVGISRRAGYAERGRDEERN